jgi:hypothetical protein
LNTVDRFGVGKEDDSGFEFCEALKLESGKKRGVYSLLYSNLALADTTP